MPTITKCCCCSLQTGCKIIGALAFIDIGYKISQSILDVVDFNLKTEKQKDQKVSEFLKTMHSIGISLERENVVNWIFNLYVTAYIDIIVYIVGFVANACFWYGVSKEKHQYFLPTLVFIPLDLVKCVAQSIVFAKDIGFTNPVGIGIQLIIIVNIAILVPIWLVIYSYKQKLRGDRGGRTHADYAMAHSADLSK